MLASLLETLNDCACITMKFLCFVLILCSCSIVVINAGIQKNTTTSESGGYDLCETTKREKGMCIPLLKCDFMRNIFESTHLTRDDKNYLKCNKCGYMDDAVLICCPLVSETETGHSESSESLREIETSISTPGDLCYTTDTFRLTGSCIPLDECQFMLDIVKKTPLTDEDRLYLKSNQCGCTNSSVLICCPSTNTTKTKTPATLLPSPDECGVAADDSIRYPWIAALVYKDGEINCTGFLINHNYVITLESCVVRNDLPALSHVLLGDWDIEKREDDPNKKKNINSYTTLFGLHVVLLKLASPVTYTNSIKPLCLPVGVDTSTNTSLEAAAWGTTDETHASVHLEKVKFSFVPTAECVKVQGSLNASTHMCAVAPEADPCHYQKWKTGGPLMGIDKSPDTGRMYHYAAGIFTYSGECGKGQPGLYIKTEAYINWIMENINV